MFQAPPRGRTPYFQTNTITPPEIMPARAPWRLLRFQNRAKSITGPKAAPKPAQAKDTMVNTELSGFQASRIATRAMPVSYTHLDVYKRQVEYVGHEMEPGHLTYFEKRLQTMIDTCWPEMSIVSQFSTSNAFGEGSARHVISMSFDNSVEKLTEFEREVIFRNAGIDPGLAELMPRWHRFCELSGYGKLESSRKIWDRVWTEEEAGRFLERYGFCLLYTSRGGSSRREPGRSWPPMRASWRHIWEKRKSGRGGIWRGGACTESNV